MEYKAKILIVDDEQIALRNLEHVMQKRGAYRSVGPNRGPNALKLIEEQWFDVVLTDLKMEKVDGMQILKKCKDLYPDTEVIMITGYASIQSAINAIKKGAYDYISKPFKLDEVRKVVKEAIEKVRLKKRMPSLESR